MDADLAITQDQLSMRLILLHHKPFDTIELEYTLMMPVFNVLKVPIFLPASSY